MNQVTSAEDNNLCGICGKDYRDGHSHYIDQKDLSEKAIQALEEMERDVRMLKSGLFDSPSDQKLKEEGTIACLEYYIPKLKAERDSLIAQVETDRKEIYNERQEALKHGLNGKALALEWKLNGIDWYKSKFDEFLRAEV